jgi:hypothetical protein
VVRLKDGLVVGDERQARRHREAMA